MPPEHSKGYSFTLAPLVIKISCWGISGGEYGIRGFIDAYDAATASGMRFYTIPAPASRDTKTWEGES